LNVYPKDVCFPSLSTENKKSFKTLRPLRLCGEHHFLKRLNYYKKMSLYIPETTINGEVGDGRQS